MDLLCTQNTHFCEPTRKLFEMEFHELHRIIVLHSRQSGRPNCNKIKLMTLQKSTEHKGNHWKVERKNNRAELLLLLRFADTECREEENKKKYWISTNVQCESQQIQHACDITSTKRYIPTNQSKFIFNQSTNQMRYTDFDSVFNMYIKKMQMNICGLLRCKILTFIQNSNWTHSTHRLTHCWIYSFLSCFCSSRLFVFRLLFFFSVSPTISKQKKNKEINYFEASQM